MVSGNLTYAGADIGLTGEIQNESNTIFVATELTAALLHLRINHINNEGILEVFFKGISIKDFDRILYFSMPDDKDFYLKSNDEKYASTELFTTVIAALKIRENASSINEKLAPKI